MLAKIGAANPEDVCGVEKWGGDGQKLKQKKKDFRFGSDFKISDRDETSRRDQIRPNMANR